MLALRVSSSQKSRCAGRISAYLAAAPSERNAQIPIDEHNHALLAQRYLIDMIDRHRITGRRAPEAARSACRRSVAQAGSYDR